MVTGKTVTIDELMEKEGANVRSFLLYLNYEEFQVKQRGFLRWKTDNQCKVRKK